jgi:APA family basic amino acid/polyamine antiporter
MLHKKSLQRLLAESEETGAHTLKRSLSAFHLVALGVGVIVGAGLFSLTGIVAAHHSGPAVTLSLVIAAIACVFSALCYAEFASMVPVAGSAYTYSFATLGELFAWIIGWDLILEYSVGAATVSISWSQYLGTFLSHYGIFLPAALTISPFESVTLANGTAVQGIANIPAVAIVVVMTGIIIRGVEGSALYNTIIVSIKVLVIVVFIGLGWSYIQPAYYQPYIPANTGVFGEFGVSGILRGAGVVFFMYTGFDMVATMSQEAKNPRRDVPIGIIGSLVICTVLYVVFAYVLTGVVPYAEFKSSAAPVAVALEKMPYLWLGNIIIVAIILGYTSVILVDLMSQSRVFFSMSRDGLLPRIFSEIHPRFRTPFKSNIVLCCFVSLFAGFVPIRVVGEMVSIGTLLAFVLVCVGVLVLRKQQPHAPRVFRVPFVPVVPLLGILSCGVMMISLPLDTWIRLAVWLAIGLVVYWLYGRTHSRVKNEAINSEALTNV